MENHIANIKSLHLSAKQLFNDQYSSGENRVIFGAITVMSISMSFLIFRFSNDPFLNGVLIANILFLFFLLTKYQEQIDVRILREKYHIDAGKWSSEYFELIQKKEFVVMFDNYICDHPDVNILKVKKKFSRLGKKSKNWFFKYLQRGIQLCFEAFLILCFIYSDTPFETKLKIAGCFIIFSLFTLGLFLYILLIVNSNSSYDARRSSAIATWIDEYVSKRTN